MPDAVWPLAKCDNFGDTYYIQYDPSETIHVCRQSRLVNFPYLPFSTSLSVTHINFSDTNGLLGNSSREPEWLGPSRFKVWSNSLRPFIARKGQCKVTYHYAIWFKWHLLRVESPALGLLNIPPKGQVFFSLVSRMGVAIPHIYDIIVLISV